MMKTKLKFFLVLLAMMVGEVNSVWGRGMFFNYPVVDFEWNSTTNTFVSSTGLTLTHINGTTYEFQQDAWWEWYQGATPNNLDNPNNIDPSPHTQDTDLYWSLDISTSNITIPTDYSDKNVDNHYELKQGYGYGSRIRFTLSSNTVSGSITVTAYQPDFDGDSYTATYIIKLNQNIHSHKWDFYSQPLTISDASGFSATEPVGEISLHAYASSVSSPTSFSTQIPATNGLLFTAPSYQHESITHYTFGYYDSAPSTNTPVNDRYIALHQGATLTIPSSVWSDHNSGIKTRIRIKMGRYGGNGIKLTIGNGKDALDNTISTTYEIGGSVWWGDKGDNNHHGEYHFIVNDKNTDFTIAVGGGTGDGTWLKLFSIEVYNSDELITENDVLSNSYQLLNTASTAASGTYYLHYRGKAESTRIQESAIVYSGNITTTKSSFASTANTTSGTGDEHISPTHTFTSAIGDFGTFTMRIECLTHGSTYCTDYASRRQSVGYTEGKSYPYTWDFKDIITYKYAPTGGTPRLDAGVGGEGNLQGNNLHLWTALEGTAPDYTKFGLRVSINGGHDVTFCGGSQLWYGQTIIPETAGLAFTPVNYDKTYNNALSFSAKGLTFDQTNRDWWGWRVTVPSVPAGGAVYIQAHKDRSDIFYGVKYYVGWEPYTVKENGVDVTKYKQVNNKTPMTAFPTETNDGSGIANIISTTGDEVVYAIYNNHNVNEDITLFFNGITVHKIAVSTDKKTFNPKGWTTESREHDIDPSLTAEMNGRGIKTFLVTNNDIHYDTKKVTMTDISNAGLMHSATDASKYACILRNTEDAELNIVNNGFYLFVPDMHDERGTTTGAGYQLKNYPESMEFSAMIAQVSSIASDATSGRIPATDGSNTNFAFTYKYYDLDANGRKKSGATLQYGAQAFYRISLEGASSIGNQGYLPLSTNSVGGSWEPLSSRFSIMFSDDDNEPDQKTTNIETISDNMQNTRSVYYNLNGQQFNGSPTRRGLYIVNGKKICIM